MVLLSLVQASERSERYKAIFFDLDDTLVDFKKAEQESLHLVHEEFYKDFVDKDQLLSLFHSINKQLWTSLEKGEIPVESIGKKRFEKLSEQVSAQVDSTNVADFYALSLGEKSVWLPGAEEAIQTLKRDYIISVITNGSSRVQRHKYRIHSIGDWCHSYIVSDEVKAFKPDKKIFDIALGEANVLPHEVLMVGDSLTSDYKGALNAGIDFCWVNPFDAICPETLPLPKYMIKSVTELVDILRGYNQAITKFSIAARGANIK